MKYSTIIITAVILGAALYTGLHHAQTEIPAEIKVKFLQWKLTHRKLYGSPSEESFRLSVFHKNVLKIKAHNAKNAGFTMALNKFADLSSAARNSRPNSPHPPGLRTSKMQTSAVSGLTNFLLRLIGPRRALSHLSSTRESAEPAGRCPLPEPSRDSRPLMGSDSPLSQPSSSSTAPLLTETSAAMEAS